jgi:hypothetical protein
MLSLEDAPRGLNRGTQMVEVALDGFRHRLAIAFPEHFAALDVSKEESGGGSREI